jgi:hypothetical protein
MKSEDKVIDFEFYFRRLFEYKIEGFEEFLFFEN